jgi:CRP-like cAMP-binding protein
MPATSGNQLLRLLPPEDLAFLRPHLKPYDLVQGAILVEFGQPIEHVYFPQDGMISLVVHLQSGGSVEGVVVGRDGVLGATVATANPPSHAEAVVQLAGSSYRSDVRGFREAFGQSAALRSLMFRYSEAMTVQAQQSAACNAAHDVPARLARWLLKSRDLMDDDVLPFTQEFLSHMLGVRRPSVTTAAQTLEAAGVISYKRGRIRITNRDGLLGCSCECYQAVKTHYDQLFPGAKVDHPQRIAAQ